MHEPINEEQEQEEQVHLGKDSMISFNERGCDEIMCQFMKDLDSTFDIDSEPDVEEVNEPNNRCSLNFETLE